MITNRLFYVMWQLLIQRHSRAGGNPVRIAHPEFFEGINHIVMNGSHIVRLVLTMNGFMFPFTLSLSKGSYQLVLN